MTISTVIDTNVPVGAHALVVGHRLPTRDASRDQAYLPGLDIVSPQARP